ncbi:glycoside hydrolase, partial [Neoconidiobolus thromboides FSU 785]
CGCSHFNESYDSQVESLIYKMNLREKVGQLSQLNIAILVNKNTLELDPKLVDYYVNEMQVGSFFNNLSDGTEKLPAGPDKWVRLMNQLQDASQKNRLKIPMIYGLDSVHGANFIYGATIFPQQLGQAATFNRTLIRKISEITAKDTRAVGVHWNFSPILDIAVNKQWPRVYETFGEDPYVAAELGRETIIGYQGCGKDLAREDKVAATMKHFIGYSSSRSGKDIDGAWMSERTINDYFRPSFQAAVEASIATTMESYSDIDGDHLVNSKQYLVDLLRRKMNFKGALITDYQQIQKLHDPIHIASSQEDAVYKVMKSGTLDISMIPNDVTFITILESLIKKGRISMNMIDNNVRRMLILKKKLGLLGSTGKIDVNSKLVRSIGSKEDRGLSLDAARESIILLHNKNNTLPLKKGIKVLVTGPTANSISYQTGGWTFSWQGTNKDEWYQGNGTTIIQGLKEFASVTHLPSIDINGTWIGSGIEGVVNASKDHDAIVVCIGEATYAEFFGNISDMALHHMQLNILHALIGNTDKPVIVVINQGRPRVINSSIDQANGVINNFLAGPYAGQAIAEIIFGEVNPSGKLPLTYANKVNDNTQSYYRRFNEDNPKNLWNFGHGLSYTSFSYSNITLSKNVMTPYNHIDVSVEVTNSGATAGKETVLMYVTDEYRTISPEIKKLRGFEKIYLNAGETKEVKFVINIKDLAFAGLDNKYIAEEGSFYVTI